LTAKICCTLRGAVIRAEFLFGQVDNSNKAYRIKQQNRTKVTKFVRRKLIYVENENFNLEIIFYNLENGLNFSSDKFIRQGGQSKSLETDLILSDKVPSAGILLQLFLS